MKQNKKLAKRLRSIGLGKLVDNESLRRALGLPIHGSAPQESQPVNPTRGQAAIEGKPAGALISVIVPAYNVATYLENAVDTVLNQTHRNLDIVIIDDGSTDGTGEIADSIALRDSRVRVIHKANAGLGAARNTGLDHTSAPYVTFVDSDDQLTPRALEVLLKSLESSGSEFAIGAVERFNSTTVWVPDWVTEVHDIDRIGAIAEDHPAVLWDVFVWNKLFRRDAWDFRAGRFPEGVLYEDQECTARLYVEGARFDSLTEIVYRWRLRDDGTSITQNKTSEHDLEQRLLVARTVQGVIDTSANISLVDTWYAKLLGDDLYWYYREVPRANLAFWEILRSGVRGFMEHASIEVLRSVRFDRRMMLFAIERGGRADLEKCVHFFHEHGAHWVTEFSPAGAASGYASVLEELSFSLSEMDRFVEPENDTPEVVLLRQSSLPDGSLELHGYLFIQNLTPALDHEVTAVLRLSSEPEGEEAGVVSRSFPLTVSRTQEVEAERAVRNPFTSFLNSGFVICLYEDVLDSIGAERPGAEWMLEIGLSAHGRHWSTTAVRVNGNGLLGRLASGSVSKGGHRWHIERDGLSLIMSTHEPGFLVTSLDIVNSSLALEFEATGDVFELPASELQLAITKDGRDLTVAAVKAHSVNKLSARVDLPKLAPVMHANYVGYDLELRSGSTALGILELRSQIKRQFGSGQYGIHGSRRGKAQVERYAQFGVAQEAKLFNDGRGLRIQGICRFDRVQVRQATPSLMLWSKDQTIFPTFLEYNDDTGEYVVEFSLVKYDADGAEVFFSQGTYLFGMLTASGHRLPASFTLLCDDEFATQLPLELSAVRTRLALRRRPSDGGLVVGIAAPFAEDERGVFAQAGLGARFSVKSSETLANSVLFESFGGRAIADSPKALDRVLSAARPDIKRFWTVRDYSVRVPAGATPVLLYSREWYEALATSKYLINNNNFPHYFRKSEGQTYVQTWHGTPLKRVGNDVPAANLSLSYRNLMRREGEQYWDYLLAQSPWAGQILASSFGFTGPVLDQGYPRNDALVSEEAEERRNQVRRYLGLSSTQRVVLYAPTWRDNLKSAGGRYVRPDYLDLQAMHKAFGRDVIVLVRGHSNNAGSQNKAKAPSAIDVSDYPDINDLCLASDLLVTDYSSVQFDYVNTGRPIIYLAPDLETYRDSVRGFYFDIEDVAPGPILRSTSAVIDYIRSSPEGALRYATAYREFRQRFAPMDNGGASQRVVSEVFGV